AVRSGADGRKRCVGPNAHRRIQDESFIRWLADGAAPASIRFDGPHVQQLTLKKNSACLRNAAVESLLDALYLARFQVSVGTNGPSGDAMGARTYVMSSPLMMLIVAFCSVPSKFGFVEP